MKVVRCFLKPHGSNWVDVPIDEGMDIHGVWASGKLQGVIVTPTCIIPIESVHLAAQFDLPDTQKPAQILPMWKQ